MLHLGVYGGCEILFDSKDVPEATFPLPSSAEFESDAAAATAPAVGLEAVPGLKQLLLRIGTEPGRSITPLIDKLYQEPGAPKGAWAGMLSPSEILQAALGGCIGGFNWA